MFQRFSLAVLAVAVLAVPAFAQAPLQASEFLTSPVVIEADYELYVPNSAGPSPGDVLNAVVHNGESPLGIGQADDGTIYVADLFNNLTHSYNQALVFQGTIPSPGGAQTTGVTYDGGSGTLWFLDSSVAPNAMIETDLAGVPTGSSCGLPNGGLGAGLAYQNSTGLFFFVDIVEDAIYAVDGACALQGGYPVPQTNGAGGNFGNGMDVCDTTFDVLFGTANAGQTTDAVITDLSGADTGPTTPVGATGDTFINDVVRDRLAPNEHMFLVGNATNTIFDVFPASKTCNPVPVELISFEAVVSGTDVSLNWATSSETNNAGFEVQMMDSGSWNALGWVEGNGTTTEAQTYSYTAEDMGFGTHMFRLKQIDFDGAFEYSDELEVTVETPGTHLISSAYPNPFNPQSQFTLAVAQDQVVTAELFNTLGQRIAVLFTGTVEANQSQLVTIDGAGLASGMYIVRVNGERFSDALSVTLLK